MRRKGILLPFAIAKRKFLSKKKSTVSRVGELALPVAVLQLSFSLSVPAQGSIESVTISSDEKIAAPRWAYGQGEAPKAGKTLTSILATVKVAQLNQKFDLCIDQARKARPKAKSLRGWLTAVEVDCATRLPASAANANKLARALEPLEKNPDWLYEGAQAATLRAVVVKGYQSLLDQDLKTKRTRAWSSVERLQEISLAHSASMDDKAKARLWRAAGELAFLQQNSEAARELLKRSLALSDSDETRSRLAVVESALTKPDPKDAEKNAQKAGQKPGQKNQKDLQSDAQKEAVAAKAVDAKPSPRAGAWLEISNDELELIDRVTAAMKGGDLIAATEDAVKLTLEFPGSTRTKWASDRILEIYWGFADKADSKMQGLREQVLKQMQKADSDRVFEWARLFYNRGQYADSLTLATKALDSAKGASRTRILEIAGLAALAVEKFEPARSHFRELIDKHAGTPSAREALLRIGLLNYRLGEHAQAVADFERLLALPQMENYEVIARYWMWRALQKTKSDQAVLAADELMRKFPFSYYGLRARMERDGTRAEGQGTGRLDWKPETGNVESRLWLTGPERIAWEKARLLLESGWLDEAQAELRLLPPPTKAEDKAVRALVWAAASGFQTAAKLANEAWDEKPELRRPPFVNAAFPNEFSTVISSQADARRLDPALVMGLIKQESGYNAKAVSNANALGLMQMVGATAREIAVDLKMGSIQLPDDLFVPERNIRMGTYYLSRLVNKYQGHIPLALAAYNAGQGRVDRWLRSRSSLKTLASLRSSAADDELWIDEIPYSETSFYVKAILRNLLLYKMLEKGRVEVGNPVWATSAGR